MKRIQRLFGSIVGALVLLGLLALNPLVIPAGASELHVPTSATAGNEKPAKYLLNLTNLQATTSPYFLQTTEDIATAVNRDHCNFTHPKLITMAKQLGFEFMRVGGTEGDYTYYDWSDHPSYTPPPGFLKVLTKKTFDEFNHFAQAIGVQLYFGLNAGWGSGVRNTETRDWEPTMARMLLEYSFNESFPIAALEFSNEPNLFFFRMNASQLLSGTQFAKDIVTVKNLVKGINPDWKLICCDVAYVPLLGEFWPFTQEFAAAGGMSHVDYTTWHFYPLLANNYARLLPKDLDPFYAEPKKILDPLIDDQVGYWADIFEKNRDVNWTSYSSSTPPPPMILGETGSAVGGGCQNLSNRFVDSLEYVDKIGQMRAHGQFQMFRQTLCGSRDQYYALISHDFKPHPSYFVTAALKPLLGPRILNITTPVNVGSAAVADFYTRVYAHCHPDHDGRIVFMVVNLANTTAVVEVELLVSGGNNSSSSAPTDDRGHETQQKGDTLWDLYQFSASSITSDTVALNGEDLSVDSNGVIQPGLVAGKVPLPPIPNKTSSATLTLPTVDAESVAFVVSPPDSSSSLTPYSSLCMQ